MLQGKKVVVFGGGSGVGLASAKLLASHGAELVISGRSQSRLEAAIKDFPGPVTVQAVDGKNVDEVRAFFEKVGPFDHLITTAGETTPGGSFVKDITAQSYRDTFEGKFFVQLNAAHAAAPHIRPGGSITFFSGGANRRALRGMSNIATVNAAIDALVPPLALELAPTRVNAISPGTLATTYWTGVPAERLEQIFGRMASALPVGRVGTAEDIANAVLFLVTTGYVTGTVLAIDGGLPHSAI